MMIVSAKVSKKKVLAGLAAAIAVIVLLVTLVNNADAQPPQETATVGKAATNEQRLAFLQSFGWEAGETPTETQEVRIPEEFNDVFTRYNEFQKEQGYDLSQYAGKSVKRYVYPILNHPDGPDHFATLLIYKNEVIGGDITGTGTDGRMHGFQKPS